MSILIELRNGEIYYARGHPKSATEDPLTDSEMVILDLYEQIEELKDMLTWCYNYVNKQEDSDEKKRIIEEIEVIKK